MKNDDSHDNNDFFFLILYSISILTHIMSKVENIKINLIHSFFLFETI